MEKDETTGVETPEGTGPETPTGTTPEEVTSPEVKVDAPEVQTETVDVAKMQAQIDNLNTALKQEREAGKTANDKFEKELARSQETIGKLKDVFSPEQQKEETQPEQLTMEQIESLLDQRDQKRQESLQKETQEKAIQAEIKTMQEEWNGENGKPQYDDKKVLAWQEEKGKLYLSPREAFHEMNRDSIIDWEIKNRMNKKPDVQSVETPSGTPTERTPQEKKPISTVDLRSAVLEAMDIASNENIN